MKHINIIIFVIESSLWGSIFYDLANSMIDLVTVVFENMGFNYYDKFEKFLEKKGSNIRKLELGELSAPIQRKTFQINWEKNVLTYWILSLLLIASFNMIQV